MPSTLATEPVDECTTVTSPLDAAAATPVARQRARRVADGIGDQRADRIVGARRAAGADAEEAGFLGHGRRGGQRHSGGECDEAYIPGSRRLHRILSSSQPSVANRVFSGASPTGMLSISRVSPMRTATRSRAGRAVVTVGSRVSAVAQLEIIDRSDAPGNQTIDAPAQRVGDCFGRRDTRGDIGEHAVDGAGDGALGGREIGVARRHGEPVGPAHGRNGGDLDRNVEVAHEAPGRRRAAGSPSRRTVRRRAGTATAGLVTTVATPAKKWGRTAPHRPAETPSTVTVVAEPSANISAPSGMNTTSTSRAASLARSAASSRG